MRVDMVVIGIDPGSRFTGWGIVSEVSGCLRLVDCGVIQPVSRNKGSFSFSERLAYIYHELCMPMKRNRVDAGAIEQVFVAQNAQSSLKLGQARGVAVAACASFGLDIFDYEPALVKKALVGTGSADKEQVAFMVKRLLNIREASWALDTTDALAVAICHLTQARLLALAARATHSATQAG